MVIGKVFLVPSTLNIKYRRSLVVSDLHQEYTEGEDINSSTLSPDEL